MLEKQFCSSLRQLQCFVNNCMIMSSEEQRNEFSKALGKAARCIKSGKQLDFSKKYIMYVDQPVSLESTKPSKIVKKG